MKYVRMNDFIFYFLKTQYDFDNILHVPQNSHLNP